MSASLEKWTQVDVDIKGNVYPILASNIAPKFPLLRDVPEINVGGKKHWGFLDTP